MFSVLVKIQKLFFIYFKEPLTNVIKVLNIELFRSNRGENIAVEVYDTVIVCGRLVLYPNGMNDVVPNSTFLLFFSRRGVEKTPTYNYKQAVFFIYFFEVIYILWTGVLFIDLHVQVRF